MEMSYLGQWLISSRCGDHTPPDLMMANAAMLGLDTSLLAGAAGQCHNSNQPIQTNHPSHPVPALPSRRHCRRPPPSPPSVAMATAEQPVAEQPAADAAAPADPSAPSPSVAAKDGPVDLTKGDDGAKKTIGTVDGILAVKTGAKVVSPGTSIVDSASKRAAEVEDTDGQAKGEDEDGTATTPPSKKKRRESSLDDYDISSKSKLIETHKKLKPNDPVPINEMDLLKGVLMTFTVAQLKSYLEKRQIPYPKKSKNDACAWIAEQLIKQSHELSAAAPIPAVIPEVHFASKPSALPHSNHAQVPPQGESAVSRMK